MARRRTWWGLALTWAGVLFFLVYTDFPIYWMVMTSFKTDDDLVSFDNFPFWFNEPPTLEHFWRLFYVTNFPVWAVNTLVVAACVVVITIALCVPGAYALARLSSAGTGHVGMAVFLTYLAPPTLLFFGLARVVAALHLWNTRWALVAIYPTLTVPFCTWLLTSTFKAVPLEVEEAAWVDGCSRLQAAWRVVLPLSVAGLLTAAMFAFILASQEFFYASTFVFSSSQKLTIEGVLTELIRGDIYFWGSLMAGATLSGIPIAILYNLCLERFVHGGSPAAG